MKGLSYKTLSEQSYDGYLLQSAPIKVLQFGEGNFLRGFVDYFIDETNEKCGLNAKVMVVQPIAHGLGETINEQNGLYTLYLRGFDGGKRINNKRVISCISHCISPYENFDAFLGLAKLQELRFITSNTTEAGIVFDSACRFDDKPPSSFPAKLTRFLYERYLLNGKGFVILPCELIDNNGRELKNCVNEYIELWDLPDAFKQWVDRENIFCSTLVDRIVTGYPRDEANAINEQNGYIDKLINTAEIFGLWVIEAPVDRIDSLEQELPLAKAGMPVLITDDHTQYKKRKVRILNGAHTGMVFAAYLSGLDIVRDAISDDVIKDFVHTMIYNEIIPTLTLPYDELKGFADSVVDRFLNPFINHELLSICLNSASKWKARNLPSIKGFYQKTGKLPVCLTVGFAAMLVFYRVKRLADGQLFGARANGDEYPIRDEQQVLDFFVEHSNDDNTALVNAVFDNNVFGDIGEIEGLRVAVIEAIDEIDAKGMYEAVKEGLRKCNRL